MGLGKTLVMLATIASSIDRGEEFVRTEKREADENPQSTVPSKATLIVAPSSCKCRNFTAFSKQYRVVVCQNLLGQF
jgi:hypothetical protein